MAAYRDSLEHLLAELSRLDILLKRELTIVRDATPEGQQDDLRGLVITESEMDVLAGLPDYLGERWRRQERLSVALSALDTQETARRAEIAERVGESDDAAVPLALPRLVERFGLSELDVNLLLIAIAPEVETRYETIYAYLQNDVTRKRPSVDLALNLIARSERDKVAARRALEPDSALILHRLIALGEEGHDRQPSFLRRFLRVDDVVVGTLLDRSPAELSNGEIKAPEKVALDAEVDATTQSQLENLVDHLNASTRASSLVHLTGRPVSLLRAAANWFASMQERSLLIAGLDTLIRDAEAAARLIRDARLHDAIPTVLASEDLDEDARRKQVDGESRLWRALERYPDVALLLSGPTAFHTIPKGMTVWPVDIRPPDFESRQRAWSQTLVNAGSDETARLADAFRFGQTQIDHAVRVAGSMTRLRSSEETGPDVHDVFAAGRSLTTPRLNRFAVRVDPKYTWDDIVLPPEKQEQLRRLTNWVRYRHRVHEEWGFGEKLSRGKGLTVLFTGPSGTGKTMATEVLANDLALDLYQIDLSSVVSKYIGETEKNLSVIFDEAADSQSILFFDEADALFGKRTEVKDAHDRYANIEVNFLLQRIEQYEGVVILASNLQRNLDDAFLRRMYDVVEFLFPDASLRERMWRAHIPAAALIEADIDFAFLGRQFKLTGGSIKNIVLDAAFRAATEGRPIAMLDVLLSTRSDLQKQGKLPTKAEFGRYYEQIQLTAPQGPLVGR